MLTFNRVHREFASFQSSIADEAESVLAEINQLSQEIAGINKVNPGNNFDLEDHLIRLIDDLTRIANVTIIRSGKSVSVSISGIAIVSGSNNLPLEVERTLDAQGIGSMRILVAGTTRELKITSGELGAMLNVVNVDIPNTISSIDTMASTLAQEVNALHRTGFDLNGNTGLDFFASTSTGAASLAINSAIKADTSLIASADATGEPGNGSLAQAISDLSEEALVGDQSLGEFQRTMVARIGTRIQEARFLRTSQQKVVEHLAMQRESVSGVSIEEEMTRLVQLEQAFVTASRLVAVADELTRTLLQLG